MDPFILIVVVFLIYMLSSGIQKRKRERQQREKQRPQEMERPHPAEETEPSRDLPPSAENGNPNEAGYDYSEFRKKLRTAWKLPEREERDGTYQEPDLKNDAEEALEPDRVVSESAPEERPISKERPVQTDTKQSAIDAMNQEQVRRWQEYAREQEAGKPTVQRSVVQSENTISSGRALTEKDAAQWVRYDAMFGEPRSRRPWKPMSPPRGGASRV